MEICENIIVIYFLYTKYKPLPSSWVLIPGGCSKIIRYCSYRSYAKRAESRLLAKECLKIPAIHTILPSGQQLEIEMDHPFSTTWRDSSIFWFTVSPRPAHMWTWNFKLTIIILHFTACCSYMVCVT